MNISKNYDFKDDKINEELFQEYFPKLMYKDFKNSDLWHNVVKMDLNLFMHMEEKNEHKIVFEGQYEKNTKNLGPVG